MRKTLGYDKNGNRTSDEREGIRIQRDAEGRWQAEYGGLTREEYSYDGLNRLATTRRDGIVVEARGYDGASRLVTSRVGGEIDLDYAYLHLQKKPETGNDLLQKRNLSYDSNGRVVQQRTSQYAIGENAVNYDSYDAEGNLQNPFRRNA